MNKRHFKSYFNLNRNLDTYTNLVKLVSPFYNNAVVSIYMEASRVLLCFFTWYTFMNSSTSLVYC